MSLVVKRFEELIRLVDELLNALAGGIRRLTGNQRAHYGKRKGRGKTRHANPNQRARQIRVPLFGRLSAGLVNFLGVRCVRQSSPSPVVQRSFARERMFSSRIAGQ